MLQSLGIEGVRVLELGAEMGRPGGRMTWCFCSEAQQLMAAEQHRAAMPSGWQQLLAGENVDRSGDGGMG